MFGKKKNNNSNEELKLKASEKIIFGKLTDDDEAARDLVLKLKDGNPLILNFEDLDELAANKLLAFFIGASVALDGKTTKINEYSYLFARREELLDGSLQQFLAKL